MGQGALKTVSIVIPVYNEAKTIHQLIGLVVKAPLQEGLSRQIICVNDCSTDGTKEKLDELPAVFTGVDFNVPDPIIIQNVTLFDAGSNPLTLHPRLPSYDAGTVDSATGDFTLSFFPPAGLQLQSARIFQLPRVAAIESMVGAGEPVAFDQLPIRPWNVSDCKPAGSRDRITCNIANNHHACNFISSFPMFITDHHFTFKVRC